MPRRSKGPWKRTQDGCWYTKVNGKPVKLADVHESYEVAKDRYHEVHARSHRTQFVGPISVSQLIDEFLEWSKSSRAPRTTEWYLRYLVSFHKFHGGKLLVENLRAHHVYRWVDAEFNNSQNDRRGAMRAIQRVINWSIGSGFINSNPLLGLEKPNQESRETFITQGQYEILLQACTDQQIKDYVMFLWETGARPQEIKVIKANHFRNDMLILERINSKGKREQRTIYPNSLAREILNRLIANYPTGKLFRDRHGNPWTKNSVRLRFRRFKKILGIPDLCATTLRHSWATRVLESETLDTTTASLLMGHKDPSTLQRNYQHLAKNNAYLKEAADKVKGSENQSS